MTRPSSVPNGTLVLDCEGLAKAAARDRQLMKWLAWAHAKNMRVITTSATLVEVIHPRVNRAALEWTLSRLTVEPIAEVHARQAAALLMGASLHGHRHAIDAMVAAVALSAPAPITILTSDPDDLTVLCGDEATVIKV
ncbi:DNA-binding protein [Streptomyces sp. 8K308]|uniref:type II toxin-antitoxin system VapC family toxin n=1 Tax=Streptomyces sp. 8K308 TaxID=2530388 RepID=UPI001046296D|nr:DNA-binding protein [Streptomyces sp. 8K308]TDC27597.1 DNA-binding protein [Streptomyces sp. 8K308]